MKVLILLALVAVASSQMSTTLTLEQLAAAIQDPTTNPALLPYLEATLNEWMEAIHSGQPVPEVVHVPAYVPPVIGSPIIVAPEIVAPEIVAPEIVAPEIVAPGPASPASSPLVQIIVNVNGQQQVAPGPVNPDLVVAPETAPENVNIVDEAPETVNVVDQAPETVNVVDQAPEKPIVVQLPELGNPVDVIAVNPPELNPIDVVAVNPPELNPIDVLHPIAVHA